MKLPKLFKGLKESRNEVQSLEDEALLKLLGVTVDGVSSNKLRHATYFTCMRIMTDTVSKLPCKLYQDKEDGIHKITDHPLATILKLRPNPYMSASDFWKCVEFQRNHYGNAIVIPEFDKRTGKLIGLYPVDFPKVQIWIDDRGIFGIKDAVWYVIRDKSNLEYKLYNEELLHFKGLTSDGLVGMSIQDYLVELIENGQSSQQYINTYFKNGLFAKGVVQYSSSLDESAEKRMVERFKRMASGIKNAGSILPMPLGFQFVPLNTTMADAQFFEISGLTIRQIAAAFGVKMHHLNDLERSTHNNIEQQQKSFYIDTLQSILTMYEQELTFKLLIYRELSQGYFIRFNVDSILRADIKTRYEAYRIGIQSGFKTPNECRRMEEDPPKEGGDDLVCNGNMQKMTQIGAFYKNNTQNTNEEGDNVEKQTQSYANCG